MSVENDQSYVTTLGIVHNCRCIVIQLSDGNVTEDFTKDQESVLYGKGNEEKGLAPIGKFFKYNPSKDEYLYKTEGYGVSPYMNVGEKYEVLKGNNFNLPII